MEQNHEKQANDPLMSDRWLPYTFHESVESLVAITASLLDDDPKLNGRLQANLLHALDVFQPAEQRQFVDGASTLLENLLTAIGEQWIDSADTIYFKPIRYNRDGKAWTEVVPANNFHFKPPEEIFATDDRFPTDGYKSHRLDREYIIGKNVSVFDSHGVKVFWGDLPRHAIKDLEGTYYVLDEHSSYFKVPEYAIVVEAERPADDPYRPEGALVEYLPKDKPMLEVAYVRSHAIGAIVRGAFVDHPHRAENEP